MPIIATWNVNSIKARLPHLLQWLKSASPNVVLLQELKVADEAFPALEIGDLGYNVATVGQKTYNGVAILSKQPIDVLATALPGDDADTQARYIEAFTGDLRVASIYLPNGNPVGTDKFTYKLGWMERLYRHVQCLLESEDAFVLGGDYNVAPTDRDVYDPKAFADDALCQPESRAAFRKIMYLGLTDAIRAIGGDAQRFTWWSYQQRAFTADHGVRIDHLLLSPQATDRLETADIDREPRGWDRPSDHTPVWCRLSDAG
ncbi:MAG: exodeoxyribonuclease III [Rhodospirillales bacterium]|nr:exodeoxyribonuclease III [Rhodospirillales bacterium]